MPTRARSSRVRSRPLPGLEVGVEHQGLADTVSPMVWLGSREE